MIGLLNRRRIIAAGGQTEPGGPTEPSGYAVFDGVDDYISTALNPATVLGSNSFTIEASVKTTGTGTRSVIGSRTSGTANVGFWISSGKPLLLVNGVNYLAASLVNDGEWHDIAATVNRVTGEVSFTLDGAADGTTSATIPAISSTSALSIGRYAASPTYPFIGNMANAKISTWAEGAPNLVAHWPLAGNADDIAGTYNGTPQNGLTFN